MADMLTCKSWNRHVLAAAFVLTLAACGGGTDIGPFSVDANGNSGFDSAVLSNTLATLPKESLNAVEQASLPFMREEEKLAHDVYAVLDGVFGVNTRTFGNIANSESTHTEAVRQLLVRYSLADPAAGTAAGVFSDASLQGLYTALAARGQNSLLEALKVGVEIEELDIHDIQRVLEGIDNQDITMVYENLMKGSRNHMRSFYKVLLQQGGSYTPTHISQADFNAIVNSGIER